MAALMHSPHGTMYGEGAVDEGAVGEGAVDEGAVGADGSTAVQRLFGENGVSLPVVASVFTPYQLLFLERVWRLIDPRPLLLLDQRAARFRQARVPAIAGARLEPLDLTGKVNDAGQAALIRRAMRVADEFVGDHPFVFLNASLQWPVNNVLFTCWRGDPRCRTLLIDDGLSTYLDLRASGRERRRNIAREVVARLRGFPRRSFYRGHPLGLDAPGVEGILIGASQAPTRLSPTGEPRFVPLPDRPDPSVRFTPDAAMFVGQGYANSYPAAVLDAQVAAIWADLKARGFRRIILKPHHFQGKEDIARYVRAGFELLDPPVTVEEMVAASEFRTIASINSTALLTCKSIYGNGVRAIAYDPAHFQPSHEARDMADVEAVFRRAGVEIVSVRSGNSANAPASGDRPA